MGKVRLRRDLAKAMGGQARELSSVRDPHADPSHLHWMLLPVGALGAE